MPEDVFLIPLERSQKESGLSLRIKELIRGKNLFGFIKPREFVALKTHFGEKETQGYVRPMHFRMLGDLIREIGAFPFLTETSTLYRGNRSNAVASLSSR